MIPPFREDGWLPAGTYAVSWDELLGRFGQGSPKRQEATATLRWVRDSLRDCGVAGQLLVDGSYISARSDPRDVDLLLIAEPGIEALKERSELLRSLLNPMTAEERGYSILYCPTDSKVLELLRTVWDRADYGLLKGVLEVEL